MNYSCFKHNSTLEEVVAKVQQTCDAYSQVTVKRNLNVVAIVEELQVEVNWRYS